MKNILCIISFAFMLSCGQNTPQVNVESGSADRFNVKGKTVIIYSTADSSSYRLSVTDTLHFARMAPMKETTIYVFVDPGKTFQTFLGIGGALTDASAETFAKLPDASRQENHLQHVRQWLFS
jgi:glucosylceramidase